MLITGAAGSIGSALALALMEGLADKLILLDRSDRDLDRLSQRCRAQNRPLPSVELVHADILHPEMLETIFFKNRPDFVFHAAALKHVPELESNPFLALENNVLGTLRLLQIADCFQVECFINVSTDKAVNPTSILGVSKRLTELFLLAVDSPSSRRISLRLGNVLGSSGSVVPRFFQALQEQQPFQITDPLASRYFLTVEETAGFLMHAAHIPRTALLLPEMGPQRKIVELAEFLLDEMEHEDEGVPMTVTGLKDGEKCSEHLTYDYEYLRDTNVPGLDEVCGNSITNPERFADTLGRAIDLVVQRSQKGLLDYLLDLVPEFLPSPTLLYHLR